MPLVCWQFSNMVLKLQIYMPMSIWYLYWTSVGISNLTCPLSSKSIPSTVSTFTHYYPCSCSHLKSRSLSSSSSSCIQTIIIHVTSVSQTCPKSVFFSPHFHSQHPDPSHHYFLPHTIIVLTKVITRLPLLSSLIHFQPCIQLSSPHLTP